LFAFFLSTFCCEILLSVILNHIYALVFSIVGAEKSEISFKMTMVTVPEFSEISQISSVKSVFNIKDNILSFKFPMLVDISNFFLIISDIRFNLHYLKIMWMP